MKVGDKAPDFESKDQNEATVKLSDFSGKKILLAFFPFAFSPVCTDELNCFEDDMNKFKDKGINVLGISVDSTWSNKAFSDKLGIKYPLLSDFDKGISKSFGVLRAEGFSERAYFVIDEDGKISFMHVMDNPGTKLDNNDLFEALE